VASICQRLTGARQAEPALRYGRQYFRPLSGDGRHFGISPYPGGILAFSRIVDLDLNPAGAGYQVPLTTSSAPAPAPSPVVDKPAGSVEIHEVDGAVTAGPARTLPLTVRAMEAQILVR
jgi:hypothetical protein